MMGDGKQHEEDKLDVDADLLLATARFEKEQGRRLNLSISVDDTINKEAIERLLDEGFVEGDGHVLSNYDELVTYKDLHVTPEGVIWWEEHNHGWSMRKMLEATR